MNKIVSLRAWRRRHERASVAKVSSSSAGRRACIEASTSNVIPVTFRRAAKPTISDHISAGILPRERQLLTTDGVTANPLATSDVPPRASMTESGVMQVSIFTNCGGVKLHNSAMEAAETEPHAPRMAKRWADIGKRLALLRMILGKSQAQLCREIKCQTTRWNNYETGERQITLQISNKLADKYGAKLDWIYRDDRSVLPAEFLAKLSAAEQQLAA